MTTIGRKIATEERFQFAYLGLAIGMSVLVGVVTGTIGWGCVAGSTIVIAVGLCRFRYERSLTH